MYEATDKIIELADGSFVDYDIFINGYDALQKCYQNIRTELGNALQLKKAMDAQEKISGDSGDPAAEQKLQELRKSYEEKKALLKGPLNSEYSSLLDRFIPAPYQADRTVMALCRIITQRKAVSIKKALDIYHEALYQMEVESIEKADQEMLRRLAAERTEIEKQIDRENREAAQLYAQAADYQAQAEQSHRDADASMTSAINSHLNRR